MAYDLYFQIVTIDELESGSSKFLTFGQTRSLGVRGLQKLINLFVKYLLTPLGSNPLDLDDGTILTSLLGSNVSPNDAEEILIMAVDKTTAAIQAYQQGQNVPDDERLASASITGYIAIDSDPGFAAQILIKNVANQALTFNLPTLSVHP